ncbi:enoyl-CoA hydratase/isomerase family protein [Natronospirillum operosum]|uniref:3-hydroxyisobutyryl-CoA hydrolase n=1 Tax=Natronospirillum operosum TaxID=2759953 RepID=A0A4Z0WBX2_9GAMM|nr:enoyl-CoA hydratase/isomerase family protein [Natronospirillum operosum]TGG91158.1 enoyl-CoA hydratase/isomerase family protein [Natronospirillum operosum]
MSRSEDQRTEPPVLFSEIPLGPHGQFRLGRATLNRPRALNALGRDMIGLLLEQLPRWAEDPNIVAVWLDGEGDRAFCAGGDVVQVYLSMTSEDRYAEDEALDYFSHEYRLDHMIHVFPKPLICWGNGIVMGGGLGLMVGAGTRVVTEQTRIAMPEITISLFPDVGGSWFLNRMPGHSGRFVALTAAHLNASDALFAGLADRFIPHGAHERVLQAMRDEHWSGDPHQDQARLDRLLRGYSHLGNAGIRKQLPASPLRQHLDRINDLVDHPTLAETVHAICGLTDNDPWLQQAAANLRQGSPTAAHVINHQLQRARHWSLAEVFRAELELAVNCCRLGEFQEGVRALLIDKDKQPRWRYPDVESVEQQFVDAHFEPLPQPNPLADLE